MSCSPAAIDACADGRHGCQHHCVSARGSYSCRCRAGYYLNQDKRSCTSKCPSPFLSIHLLLTPSLPPPPVSPFLPTPLLLSPVIDYCSFGNHSCQHECVSIPSGHYCRCRSGFTLQPDGRSCRGTSWHGVVANFYMPCLVPRGRAVGWG